MIFFSKESQEKGFTIVELAVVMAIIFIISGIAAANYRHGDRRVALDNQAFKFMQDARRAQELALSSRDADGVAPAGYGIYLANNRDYYLIYADKNNNKKYDDGEEVENVSINEVVETSALEASQDGISWSLENEIDINYAAPNLTAKIMSGGNDYVAMKITFRIIGDSRTRAAVANIAGLVYVE